ncbi:MAG: RNase adapter RapZ [Desulfobacterales bacterium]|nr:RNase adapter RapZ [Desulfobacterales bacterium]
MKNYNIVIITGLSGSGKSTALGAFEDAGFYCVDNMPVELLPKFLELPIESTTQICGLAFVMDLRDKGFIAKYPPIFEKLKHDGYKYEILFLEADEKILVRRYSQTRRHHPLLTSNNLIEGIQTERDQLTALRKIADKIINTTNYTIHELKSAIKQFAQKHITINEMRIYIISFGFKYGIPSEIDMLMDVRFLPNPFFVPELKAFDGECEPVRNYVMQSEVAQKFLTKFFDMVEFLIPLYKKEGKAYLTIGIGCTGGKHRSVAIARELHTYLSKRTESIELNHRDIELE